MDLKEALKYTAELAASAEKTEVVEICGHTYANRSLVRYDKEQYANTIKSHTLSSLIDYIGDCYNEFNGRSMIIHVVSPKQVVLMTGLDADHNREYLFEASAETSEFKFDSWYSQERFIIELQANFVPSKDLALILQVAGNVEAKSAANYGDDGMTQKATITSGIVTKEDVIVPNPVELVPYRTFQEIEQPASRFVFRIGDKDQIGFKLIEANGGIWKNEAIRRIKEYINIQLDERLKGTDLNITVIG